MLEKIVFSLGKHIVVQGGTFLNDAVEGDIVIRHKINGKGVEIAAGKNLACLITQTPQDGAWDKAKELNFPLIVVDKIELATMLLNGLLKSFLQIQKMLL